MLISLLQTCHPGENLVSILTFVYIYDVTCSVIHFSLFIQSWNWEYDRFKHWNNVMPKLIKFLLCFWQAACYLLLLSSVVRVEYCMSTIDITWILDFCIVLGETSYFEVKIQTCHAKCVKFGSSALGALLCSLHRWVRVAVIYRNPGLHASLVQLAQWNAGGVY